MKVLVDKCQDIAREIFNELGCGFDESIYQRAFEVSLRLAGYLYENKKVIPVYYKGYNVGDGEADLVVYGGKKQSLVIELKAIGAALSPKEETQLRKYLELLGIETGLLINFPQAGRKEVPEEPEIRQVSI
ncbi:hypothetical protein LCGC14_3083770 [marine sediment metagenome]|uniref:GxxExxY protein n=1 Tax=marine sediment metagenome TaxID=412755 RepID=A0A0F8X149_9ZZZZ